MASPNNLGISRRRHLFALVAIAAVVIPIYANSLDGSFHLDDMPNIVENRHVHMDRLSFGALYRAAFESRHHARPLANVTFALNHLAGGLGVQGYHIVNIAVHVAAASILYFLLLRIIAVLPLSERIRSRAFQTALFATLIWAAHPVQIQAVTYIVQRMTSMAALFYFAALLFYLEARRSGGRKRRLAFYCAFLAAYLLGVGSKEIVAAVPFAVLLCDWLIQDRRRSVRQWALVAAVMAALSIAALWFHLVMHDGSISGILLRGYEDRPFTMEERMLTQFRIILFYMTLLAFPHPGRLNVDHDFSVSAGMMDPPGTLLAVAAVTWLVVGALMIARRRALVAFCILWFFGNLTMESTVVPLEMIFEHRLYIPLVGPALLLSAALAWMYGGEGGGRARRIGVSTLMAVILVVCGFWTVQRNTAWRTEFSLWSDAARKSPAKVRVVNNLANVLADSGKLNAAISRYRKILKKHPESARVHNNLGSAYFRIRRPQEAMIEFRRAVLLQPGYGEAWLNLGICLASVDRLEEAVEAYERARSLLPDHAELHYNMGNALKGVGRDEEAAAAYLRCIELDPVHALALNNLGSVYYRLDRWEDAVASYRRAVRVDPTYAEPHFNQAIILADQGDRERARREMDTYLEMRPDEDMTEKKRAVADRIRGGGGE